MRCILPHRESSSCLGPVLRAVLRTRLRLVVRGSLSLRGGYLDQQQPTTILSLTKQHDSTHRKGFEGPSWPPRLPRVSATRWVIRATWARTRRKAGRGCIRVGIGLSTKR